LYGPAEHQADCGFECELAGVVQASEEDARIVRLECGMPRYGEDIMPTTLPQETQIAEAVSFTKGCYLGQEIVERIRSRGHVNRLLVRLEWDGPLPETAPKLFAGSTEAGHVTSYAYSPGLGRVVALGYVRAQFVKPGAVFDLEGGIQARVAGRGPTLGSTSSG
jgi:tRNA-modifying protein YgfZ